MHGLIETLAIEDKAVLDVDLHGARLRDSWRSCLPGEAPAELRGRVAATWSGGPAAGLVRLAFELRGDVVVEHASWRLRTPVPVEPVVGLVDDPRAGVIESRHKSLDRRWVEACQGDGDFETLVCRGDAVIEGTRSNLFVWSSGELLTPPVSQGALPGIVRARVLQAARRLSLPGREATVSRSNLSGAEAVLLSGSGMGLVRVARVGDRRLAAGEIEELAALSAEVERLRCRDPI